MLALNIVLQLLFALVHVLVLVPLCLPLLHPRMRREQRAFWRRVMRVMGRWRRSAVGIVLYLVQLAQQRPVGAHRQARGMPLGVSSGKRLVVVKVHLSIAWARDGPWLMVSRDLTARHREARMMDGTWAVASTPLKAHFQTPFDFPYTYCRNCLGFLSSRVRRKMPSLQYCLVLHCHLEVDTG